MSAWTGSGHVPYSNSLNSRSRGTSESGTESPKSWLSEALVQGFVEELLEGIRTQIQELGVFPQQRLDLIGPFHLDLPLGSFYG